MKIEIGDKVSFKKVVKGNYTISENVSKILDNSYIVKNVSNEKILISSHGEDIWIPKSFVEKIICKHLTNKEKRRIEELNSEFEKSKTFRFANFLYNCCLTILGICSALFVPILALAILLDIWQILLFYFGIATVIVVGIISIYKIVEYKCTKLKTKARKVLATEEYKRLKNYLCF